MVAAIDLALAGRIAGIVTAPLNKEAMRLAGIDYPGHTEILAARSGTQDFAMMLANDELRVILVSIHVSLRDAIDAATVENELRAFHLAQTACRALGIAKPRIAVAGLNPHAGENGLFGREDLDVIVPAIALAREQGLTSAAPGRAIPFSRPAREFDIVVAQYHDQGLIPVKYLGWITALTSPSACRLSAPRSTTVRRSISRAADGRNTPACCTPSGRRKNAARPITHIT